jgi:hypothetical protein
MPLNDVSLQRALARIRQRRSRMPALQPGTQAPEFSLASHLDKPYALNSYRGKKTVVAFLPFAFTGG